MLHITGIAASAGLAVGPVKRINRASSGLTRVVLDSRREKALFEAAVLLAKDELAELEQRADQNDKDIFPRGSGVCRETDRSRKAHASGKNRRYVVLFCAKHQTLSIAGKSRERGQIQGKARSCS